MRSMPAKAVVLQTLLLGQTVSLEGHTIMLAACGHMRKLSTCSMSAQACMPRFFQSQALEISQMSSACSDAGDSKVLLQSLQSLTF